MSVRCHTCISLVITHSQHIASTKQVLAKTNTTTYNATYLCAVPPQKKKVDVVEYSCLILNHFIEQAEHDWTKLEDKGFTVASTEYRGNHNYLTSVRV